MNEACVREFEELTEEYLELNKQALTRLEMDNIFSAYDEPAACTICCQQKFDDYYS